MVSWPVGLSWVRPRGRYYIVIVTKTLDTRHHHILSFSLSTQHSRSKIQMTPALLCHKETAQGTQSLLLGAFLPFTLPLYNISATFESWSWSGHKTLPWQSCKCPRPAAGTSSVPTGSRPQSAASPCWSPSYRTGRTSHGGFWVLQRSELINDITMLHLTGIKYKLLNQKAGD